MTLERSEEEQLLYVATDEILFTVWDALCLSIDQKNREQYLPYLPYVFDLLKETVEGQEIFDYLLYIEEEIIGTIPGDQLAARRASRTVDILLKYKKKHSTSGKQEIGLNSVSSSL